jgi:anthranilate phosphoribosyltransferase
MNISKLFEQLITANHLTSTQMQQTMTACMNGELSDVQIAVFLALMRMKGETVEELSAAATVMIDLAHCVDLGDDIIDIVGTGGDGKNTFNISTVSSIVAASAGARVAKHGNRSVSSKSGSADLLIQAGFELHLSDLQLQECMKKNNLCFLLAPHFHQALFQASSARQQLGIRSFFNLLGPLINPAKVKKQVVGVFEQRWQYPLAQVLANLGSERAFVICSRDGMDEVSICDITDVIEYHHGHYSSWSIDPRDYDCYHQNLDTIVVTSPAESLKIIESVLDGQPGPARDIVLLNTALALYCAKVASDFKSAMLLSKAAIDSGKAKNHFMQLRDFHP